MARPRLVLPLLLSILLCGSCSDDNETRADGGGPLQLDGGKPDRGKLDQGKLDKGKLDQGKLDQGKLDQGKLDQGKLDQGIDSAGTIMEKEPNDGKTSTQYQAVSKPVIINGAIGKPDDIDLFGLQVAAGERLLVKVHSGGTLQVHLAVFDLANKLPSAVSAGPGNDAMAEYYALAKAATLLVGIRDRRNVGKNPQHVGGPKFTYTVTIMPLSRAPIPITKGTEKISTLAPPGTVRVFSFAANKGDQLRLQVRASQLSPPSDMDSRLSLFCVTQKTWHGTNDDGSVGLKDSLLKGSMPFSGTYHAIVENVKLGASKLAFGLKITKQ